MEAGPRDWGHLPAVAIQALGKQCCRASKAKLRQVCRTWRDALATQFTDVYVGPGSHWPSHDLDGKATAAHASVEHNLAAVQRYFPSAATLHVTASSTRDYPASYTQDLCQLLGGLSGLLHLTLQELHELEDFDNLDSASLWDALEAVLPCLAPRLVGLNVLDCFWNDPELFGVLGHLTTLTQLKLANNPLETAYEVNILASMSQLRVLEFGLIFDGASQHHDVPRALEAIGSLQQLQELSLPMWRRSLGGRAHPLAPALSAALGRLTQLTSLAVDGKFGHLGVVSCLTNLRRLASAAPLSVEGWEAISKLPQLTLLTSFTPRSEPLRLNPARPHPGLDLALLASKSSLVGLDVGVMQPEHLATIAQFTHLERLNLRCAATSQQPCHQAKLLIAFSCLPSGLTSLQLGPLLPLSAQLIGTIARSCPQLRTLQARFTHVAATTPPAAVAAAASTGLQAVGSGDLVTAEPVVDQDMVDIAVLDADGCSSTLFQRTEGTDPTATAMDGSSCSVSQAVRSLHALRTLELALTGAEADDDGGCYHGSSGGGAHLRVSSSGNACLLGGPAGTAGFTQPYVQLRLEDLPQGLEQLSLTGSWLLASQSPAQHRGNSVNSWWHAPQRQQACSLCGRADGAGRQWLPCGTTTGQQRQLCECMKGLGAIKLGSQCSSTPNIPTMQQQRSHGSVSPAATVPGGRNAFPTLTASLPKISARPVLKRPGSHPALLTSVQDSSTAGMIATVGEQSRAAGRTAASGDVFVLEQHRGLEKRTRSGSGPLVSASVGNGSQGIQAVEEDGLIKVDASLQQQQCTQLPALADLCLYGCHIAVENLAALVATAGVKLRKLQLLRIQTTSSVLSHSAAGQGESSVAAQRQTQSIRNAALFVPGTAITWQIPGELTAQQLVSLPVAWEHLQEWHLHPHQLFEVVKASCFAVDGSSSASPKQQAHLSNAQLQRASQLLNLRHLYVVNRPAAFAATFPSVKDRKDGEAILCLPLHHKPSVQSLLNQLQAWLQQMPALRQLLLYMGHVMKQQPDLPDACTDVWTEAGEKLLEVMPACKVKHYKPTIVDASEAVGMAPSGMTDMAPGRETADAAGDMPEYMI